MERIGWKFYYVFIFGNLSNAIFFWALLPETARRPLEEMNYLFEHAPWWVPGTSKEQYISHDLENRLDALKTERAVMDSKAEEDTTRHQEKI